MRDRKIVTSRTGHNRAALVLLAAGLILVSACGGSKTADDQAGAGRSVASQVCPAIVTDHGVAAVYAMADRVAAGEDVSLEEMSRIYAGTEYDRWRRSYVNEVVTQGFLGRMLLIALRGEEAVPERLQDKNIRIDIIRALTESTAERENIQAMVDGLMDGAVLCRVRDELRGWVPEESIPDTLRVDLVLGYPEIRYYEGHIMVDAGLAWAAGEVQLPRFIASILYKDADTILGPPPKNTRGENILLESLRLVRNLVAPAMIEHTDAIVFDRRHDVLGGHGPDPLSIYEQAYRTLRSLDQELTRLRGRAQTTDDDWMALFRLFVGAQSWQATAWYMGQIIDERLGREVLQENLHSVADLYATYQRACLARPDASDAAEGSQRWFRDRPPRFSDENAAWLETKLRARFS